MHRGDAATVSYTDITVTRLGRRLALRLCPPFVFNSSADTKPLQWLHDELEDGAHSLAN